MALWIEASVVPIDFSKARGNGRRRHKGRPRVAMRSEIIWVTWSMSDCTVGDLTNLSTFVVASAVLI
jgi:hypothetical protein